VGAVAAIGVFLWVHGADLGKPDVFVEAFDPASVQTVLAMGGEGARCQMQGIGSLIGVASKPTNCDLDSMLAPHRGKEGLLGKLAESMAGQTKGLYTWPDGTFRSSAPPLVQLREVQNARCFQTDTYSVGDRGLHAVTEQPREGDTISLPRYLAMGDAAARRVGVTSSAERDAALVDFFNRARRSARSFIASSAIPACRLQKRATPAPSTRPPLLCCASGSPLPTSPRPSGRSSGRNSSYSPQLRRTSSPALPVAGAGRQGVDPTPKTLRNRFIAPRRLSIA
jgi:hypothetical protein